MTDETDSAGNPEVDMLDAPPPISAELRAKILADPNVAKIAKELGKDLDEYVNTIGYYINNPGTEPGFLVVDDDDLRKMGVEPPTAEQLEANVRQSVEAFKAGQAPSGFDAPRRNTLELAAQGGKPVEAAPDPDLEDTVKKSRRPGKF
ncbi:MAG: hypothetical protein JNJ54_04910 [Myxococcaceae bacterium]|nr:hypothetical protein [Myxococcaceae bacterium]